MRKALVSALCAAFVIIGLSLATAGDPPKMQNTLVFTTKYGPVTFPHLDHARRVKGDCAVCHDAVFKMSLAVPLRYKGGVHSVAEKTRSSCAKCHAAKGMAFAPAGNCKRCHQK